MSSVSRHPTACKNCRRRGRKCDRTLPSCVSCQDRGVSCEGYVTRWVGVAARGKLAGKDTPILEDLSGAEDEQSLKLLGLQHSLGVENSGSSSASGAPTASLESGSAAETTPLNFTLEGQSATLIPPTTSPVAGSDNLAIIAAEAARSDGLEGLIKYYIQDLTFVTFIGSEPGDSPYLRYILPVADTVPSIRYAIAALAASHLGARVGNPDLERRSLTLRLRATELLRSSLQDPSIFTRLETLASTLMLAQLDMCSGDCAEFEIHLAAGAAILKSHDTDQADQGYFEQRLIWLDIIGATTSFNAPRFTSAEVESMLDRASTSQRGQWSFDVFPCPIDLFRYIADATMLYKLQSDHISPSAETMERYHMIEAWRLALILYITSLFPSTSTPDAQSSLAKDILRHVRDIPAGTAWRRATNWALFQAGLVLRDRDMGDQKWLDAELKSMLAETGCRHYGIALEKLRLAWKSGHVHVNSITAGANGRRLMLG